MRQCCAAVLAVIVAMAGEAQFGKASAQVSRPTSGGVSITIPDAPTCGNCRIVSTTIVRLGIVMGRAASGIPFAVRVDPRGRYWVAPGYGSGNPRVYDAKGNFVRILAGIGRGPNEYTGGVDFAFLGGDSHSRFDFPTGARSCSMPRLNQSNTSRWSGRSRP